MTQHIIDKLISVILIENKTDPFCVRNDYLMILVHSVQILCLYMCQYIIISTNLHSITLVRQHTNNDRMLNAYVEVNDLAV